MIDSFRLGDSYRISELCELVRDTLTTNAPSTSVTAMWIAVSRQRMVSPAAYSGETFDWMADGFGAKRDYFLNVWVSCSLKTIFKI